jgi:hypothetical protein
MVASVALGVSRCAREEQNRCVPGERVLLCSLHPIFERAERQLHVLLQELEHLAGALGEQTVRLRLAPVLGDLRE